jgi:type IV pilus assembly protein PilY1
VQLGAVAVFVTAGVTSAWSAPPVNATAMEPVPPNVGVAGNNKAMMMLTASKDHTLFGPMYTDFEDLDGDGIIDVTFKPDFKYYGYFDSTKCYLYNTTNKRFEPDTNALVNSGRYVCGDTGQWAGNFLNWATMTRLDVVRKMLYGGQRYVDSTTETVLQIARLSRDSHSFVKYYRGTDIRDYTPFTTASLTKTTGNNPNVYAGLSMCVQTNTNDNLSTSTPQIRLAKGNYRMWSTVEGGTVCNWGSGILGNKLSRYYGGTEAYQGNGGVNHESSPPNEATDGAYGGSGKSVLDARVQVCVSTKLGGENCQAYANGASVVYKPIGLLQSYGTPQGGATSARAEFGLMTGSYDENLKAGALRKNVGDLSDEIKPTTGQFCFSSGASCSGTLVDGRSYTTGGAIKALDSIVLIDKNSGGYAGSNAQLPSELVNGTLSAWGNPVGEMVVQALRYYAGLSSGNPTSTSKDTGVGMPVATWVDPLSNSNTVRTSAYGNSVCRPLNVLAVSSSALSFDGNDADTAFSTLPNRSRGSLAQFTDVIGTAEGIHGTLRSVGNVSGTWGEECSAKTVGSLAQVNGICPEAPAIGGSFKIAGAALYGNTNPVRTITNPPPDLPEDALRVRTYAASLAGGVARIEVPIPGTNPKKYVYITPEGLWDRSKKMPAAMLTFNAISSSATHGAFMVTWNDALFGGDYDMDIAGYIRYDIVPTASVSSGYSIKITTDIINVGAGLAGSHGFSVMGTSRDGRYITHRHGTNDAAIRTASGYLCGSDTYRTSTNLSTLTLPASGVFPGIPVGAISANSRGDWACDTSSSWNTVRDRDSPVSITIPMVGAEGVTLEDPLWYAAKYGSFNPVNKQDTTELPNSTSKWDVERNDGANCSGADCSDGQPDGYFLARRPELLEKRLEALLRKITSGSNSSPAVSSSQLAAGGYLYMASFSKENLWGTVKAFQLSSTGTFSTETWDASKKLADMPLTSRQIITNLGSTGVPFTSTSLPSTSASFTALKGTGGTLLTDDQVLDLISYVRGDRSKEAPTGPWRLRALDTSKPVSSANPPYLMGTVVNASPWLQSVPAARLTYDSSYKDFVEAQKNRISVLWAASNDGMLHSFAASGSELGKPLLSYVPSPLLGRLRDLSLASNNQISAGMDGSPYTADVKVNSAWKTYLFSSLGRGGKAVFALDVTNPVNFNETQAANVYKWMFSTNDDSDLGYVSSDVKSHPDTYQASTVVRMENDKYALLVPNGINSTNGKAFLYILFVDGPAGGTWTQGTHYIKLATDNLTNNGLIGVTWADTDRNGKADTIYGTDLQGRLWKFDVRSSNPAQWQTAFSGAPMFEALDGASNNIRVPVMTPPVVTFPSFGGVMVGFGTGKSLVPGDFPNSSFTQRFYGIYDKAVRDSVTGDVIITNATEINGTTSTASQFNKNTNGGWYLNFPADNTGSTLNSEMLLSSAEVAVGTLYFTTVRPAPTSSNRCFRDPLTTFYAIDPVVGTPKVTNLGTVEKTINGKTVKINIAGKDGGGTQKRAIGIMMVNGKRTVVGAGSNAMGAVDVKSGADVTPARSQWREVPNMRTLD